MASKRFACVVLVMCMVVLGALVSEAAIPCGEISSLLNPCVPFFTIGLGPSGQCCDGVKRVNEAANTTPDRQATCRCLKSLAVGVPNLNMDNAAALPGKCGVNIPYPIRLDIDCDTIRR